MKTITDTMIGLKDSLGGKCLICNEDDIYNVCILCDAKVTARKAYKRYYSNCMIVDRTTAPDIIKRSDKERYKKEATNYFTEVGLNGLDVDEKSKFLRYFGYEFEKLLSNFDYMCKVVHFDTETQKFNDNRGQWYDELKEFNRRTVR